MAGYSTSNPPVLVRQGIGNQTPSKWVYSSVDASTVVDAAGYFTNGHALGMKVNDIVEVTDSDTGLMTTHIVNSVTAGGAADLTDAVASTTVTDSD